MARSLAGIHTPIVTPFTSAGDIDEAALTFNVGRYARSPLTGLVVLGSNGEAALLDDDEADRAVAVTREALPAERPLIAGTGRESTRAAIAAAKRAASHGADAVLVRTPSFFKGRMTTEALVAHYRAVADASPVPVLLYNVTTYTGVNMLPEAVATLSEHPNIAGMKESNADVAQIAEHRSRAREGFVILAGAAATLFPALVVGASGAVLAVAGLLPDAAVALARAVAEGQYDEARRLQRQVGHIGRLIGSTYGVPGLKAALDITGFRGGPPRAPLTPATPDVVEVLRRELAAIGMASA